MNIRAAFSAGDTALTVHGLTQWDYGRKLEITHPDLPAIVEVHFAAVGAREATVRVVEGTVGVAEAPIPDELLEQSRPVLAWIYVVSETSGETMLTVTMPVQTRARPTVAGPVPEPIADKYTQAVEAMNAAVESAKSGGVVVAKALEADHATRADNANYANDARRSAHADVASEADHAAKADQVTGTVAVAKRALEADRTNSADYATEADTARYTAAEEWMQFTDTDKITANPENVLQVCVAIGNYDFLATLSYNVAKATRTALGAARVAINGNESYNLTLVLEITAAGKIAVYGHGPDSGGFIQVPASAITGIYYRFI